MVHNIVINISTSTDTKADAVERMQTVLNTINTLLPNVDRISGRSGDIVADGYEETWGYQLQEE